MATSKPMLGDLELQQVQKIEVDEDQTLAQQGVPALEGDFLQRLGRRASQISLTGVLTGSDAGAGLKTLQEKFRAAESVSFVADIATATKVDQVLIEELGMRELAGKPERFEYALTLREFVPPPQPQQEPPPPPPPPPPSVDTGTLVVDVTVTGQPGFDFSKVSVSVEGTQDDGASLSRTITQRSENTWTDDHMPPGQYTVTAMETDSQSMSGSASATIQVGQTAHVTITLTPASNIAQTFIVHYRFDKAFIEPAMRQVLKQVADYAQAHTGEKLLIVGHTDLVGNDSYNQSLSERRARGVFAYLTFGGDSAAQSAALAEWNALRAKRPAGEDPSIKDNWDVHEYQHILQDLGFYTGNVDGLDGPLTQNAVSVYRCKKGLPPGTTVDDQTWEALIKDYLSQDQLSIQTNQFLPCSGEILKWLGCGEKDPVKNTRSAWRPNRRTEMLFVQASQLPCKVPQPATFDLPAAGAVNSNWCFLDASASRNCFVTPAKDPCTSGDANRWCRQPAEPGTLTVTGSIKRKQPDGSLVPVPNQKFVLIAPDGQFKAGEQSSGEPQPARTDSSGNFTFSDLRVGIYSLEVIAPVLVRLAEDSDQSSKGNAVIKHLGSATDHLDVVIVNAPAQREITLPVAAHLMTALHPLTREVRTCPSVGGGPPKPQATVHTDDEIRTAFAAANDIWQQARIQFNLTDIVREAYAFRTDCEIDDSEFNILLERCAYPGAVNVFFVGDLAGRGEAGGGISPEDGAALNIAGCVVGDRFQSTVLGPPLDVPLNAQQTAHILAHELGHYLNLDHADETPANANRLMLPGTTDGSNNTLTQDELNSARASKGASDNCVSLSLKVSGATQVGGTLSNKYIVLQNAANTVTIDAVIPDSLLDPSRGTLAMTGGSPGANDRQRVVNAAAKGLVPVIATYTPAGGGDAITAQVEIRVATFSFGVDGATQSGGANSTTFVATRDANQVVTVKAVIDPELFCVPSTLVIWTGGTAIADPLRRTVSRANAASTTLSVTLAGTTQTVTITITAAQIDVIATATAAAPPLTFIRFGLWNQGYDAAENIKNDLAENNNFVGADKRKFHFRVNDPSASGQVQINWKTLKKDNTDDDAPAVQTLTLLETAPGSKLFISKAVMLVTNDTDRNVPTNSGLTAPPSEVGNRNAGVSNHRTRRAAIDGFVRGEYSPGAGLQISTVVPVLNRNPDERKRVNARVIRYTNAADPTYMSASDAYIAGQFEHANQHWNQIGIQIDHAATVDRQIPMAALRGGRFPFVHPNGAEEQAVLADLIPLMLDNTITVVFVHLTGANAYAAILQVNPVPLPGGGTATMDDRFFIFINTTLLLTDETLAHEFHHVLFNRLDAATGRRFFTLNTRSPASWVQGTGIVLPDARIYTRIQNLNSPDPDNDPNNDNIINWARRVRTARYPAAGGLGPATATTGNKFLQNF
jgi:outer membrane protein OmpA-like peptidoglycan-associated protein